MARIYDSGELATLVKTQTVMLTELTEEMKKIKRSLDTLLSMINDIKEEKVAGYRSSLLSFDDELYKL